MSDSYARFNSFERQVLALAAVAQSAALVHRLAATGEASADDVRTSANTLISLDPDSLAAIVPSPAQLSLGLRTLQQILGDGQAQESALLTRYTLSMLHLRSRLLARDDMTTDLQQTLSALQPLRADNAEHADAFFATVAELYQRTVSQLRPRIQVSGRVEHLKDPGCAEQIRTLLLAGIRAAVLWYQLGGRRWSMLFQRRKIQVSAGEIRRKMLTLADE